MIRANFHNDGLILWGVYVTCRTAAGKIQVKRADFFVCLQKRSTILKENYFPHQLPGFWVGWKVEVGTSLEPEICKCIVIWLSNFAKVYIDVMQMITLSVVKSSFSFCWAAATHGNKTGFAEEKTFIFWGMGKGKWQILQVFLWFIFSRIRLRVGHGWATSLSLFTFMHWRRKWQPTPVLLPGESQGWGSLVGFHLWDRRVGHDWSDLAAAATDYLLMGSEVHRGFIAIVHNVCFVNINFWDPSI